MGGNDKKPEIGMSGGFVFGTAGKPRDEKSKGGPGVLAPGTEVEAVWKDGDWYPATIRGFDGTHYAVRWADGSPDSYVAPHNVRQPAPEDEPLPQRYALESHVKVRWSDGQLYGATITKYDGRRYEVFWDDRSGTKWVSEGEITPDESSG